LFRLATQVGNNRSRNQTLDNDFATTAIGLDAAYATIKMTEQVSGTFGKMDNPIWAPQKSPLMWDGDITPEGLALGYKGENLFVTGAFFIPDADGRTQIVGATPATVATYGSTELGALQIGYKGSSFALATTYYTSSSENTIGQMPMLSNGSEFINVGGEYTFNLGATMNSTLYADYAINQDESTTADSESSYLVGLNFKQGKDLKKPDWTFGLAYLVFGDEGRSGYHDSDFNGGNKDSKGYKVNVGYNFAKNTEAAITYFSWEDPQSKAKSFDKSTLQADLNFKF